MNQPFDTKCAQLDDLLGVGRSFDMVSRELYVGGRRAKMWVVNGYAKDMLLERAVEKLQEVETLDGISGVDELLRRYITVCDAGTSRDRMQAVTDVFAGKTLLIIDGFSGGILLDAKTFPTRSVQEPDAGKVLRGSHDGFVESIMENAALLRRRRADMPHLTTENLLTGVLHNRLGRTLVRYAGYDLTTPLPELGEADLQAIAAAVHDFALPVQGTLGFDGAQVTAGGIRTEDFDPETLQSRLVPGLYAAGEVLDIDGDCGGYNLQWAWSSGHLAGQLLD